MTAETKSTLEEGLKLYEASVKRQQTAKPKFASVFQAELANIAAARVELNAIK